MAIGTSSGQQFESEFDSVMAENNLSQGGSESNLSSLKSESYPSSQGSEITHQRPSYEATGLSIIRHGATKLNSEDASDRIRGHSNVPLNDKGIEEAHKLGEKLKNSKDAPDLLISSDLSRATKTAEIVSKHTGIPVVEHTEGLRPWDVGEHTGKLSSESAPILADYAANRPDEKIPGGESFNDFKARFLGTIDRITDEHPGQHIGMVSHYRNERLLASLDENGEVDRKEFLKKGDTTGEIHKVNIPLEKIKMAGELVPYDFTNKEGSNWMKAGPSTQTPREQAIKIQSAPATGNITGFVSGKVIK